MKLMSITAIALLDIITPIVKMVKMNKLCIISAFMAILHFQKSMNVRAALVPMGQTVLMRSMDTIAYAPLVTTTPTVTMVSSWGMIQKVNNLFNQVFC